MSPVLSIDDFTEFFREVHGCSPFPWQERLASQVAAEGRWPAVLDLPTGFGKTAALDIAVFHLALEANRGGERRAPVRIALVVDRRIVVDDALRRADTIAQALLSAEPDSAAGRVAERLRILAGKENPPLVARGLRGGIPREDDWARTPSQPVILCSTVDQVGSRLLFRGYGVSDRMKPVHAGLIGADCLILLDEAHLSEPFRQTLEWVGRYKTRQWRESHDNSAPWGVALLTATPGTENSRRFDLDDEDYANSMLNRRWNASKPARLVDIAKAKLKKSQTEEQRDGEETDSNEAGERRRVEAIKNEAADGLKALWETGVQCPAIAVVVNRVARAREIFEQLRKKFENDHGAEAVETILMIGPARPVDRDNLAEKLAPIRTGNEQRALSRPLLIVSTQCIEAGVDIDLDGLITEAAPLDALRQRFGRLNRSGREIASCAAVVGPLKDDKNDPVYGDALMKTWTYLIEHPDHPASKKGHPHVIVDFGLAAFAKQLAALSSDPEKYKAMLSPKPDAPVLMPAHLDLLSQTAPIPNADPEVSLYLHGPNRAADSVSIVWRADFDLGFRESIDARRLLLLMPPRAAETIELPVWTVRQWLTGQKTHLANLADVPAPGFDADLAQRKQGNSFVFRWAGDDDRSKWIAPSLIRPGDTIIVPASYGGVDRFGWNPNTKVAADVANEAAWPFAKRRFVVRVAPGLLSDAADETRLAQAIAATGTSQWQVLYDAITEIGLPHAILENLKKLPKGKKKRNKVEVYTDLYGRHDGCPRGVVFVAPFGIESAAAVSEEEGGWSSTTEDDAAGSLPGFALPLKQHCEDVERLAEHFGGLAGLPENRIADLKIAAYLHDAGKVDPRFQSWLAYGDPLGPDPDQVLAKSGRQIPPQARTQSDLPAYWRHEALSVRLAAHSPRFKTEAKDQELVLWLIGTHHGHGRPFFPHADSADCKLRSGLSTVLGTPQELPAEPGPQSLAYDWHGRDWASLYEQLKARYGIWELARMEAILRLADHRASEEAARRQADEEENS